MLSSPKVYSKPIVLETVSVDRWAFGYAFKQFLQATIGGASLFAIYGALGYLAKDADAQALAGETAMHYSHAPVLAVVLALAVMVLLQLAVTVVPRGRTIRVVAWVGTLILESLSHIFSFIVGISIVSAVAGWHKIGPLLYLHGAKMDTLFTAAMIVTTAICGYWASLLIESRIPVEGRLGKTLGVLNLIVFLALLAGLIL